MLLRPLAAPELAAAQGFDIFERSPPCVHFSRAGAVPDFVTPNDALHAFAGWGAREIAPSSVTFEETPK